MLDLQLQRFAVAHAIGFVGDELAADVVQATGGLLADLGEAFLGGDQLLLHEQQLLVAPPAHTGQGDGHGCDQRPQRTGPAATFHRRGQRTSAGLDHTARVMAEFVAVGGVGGKVGHIIEFVERVITHGMNLWG